MHRREFLAGIGAAGVATAVGLPAAAATQWTVPLGVCLVSGGIFYQGLYNEARRYGIGDVILCDDGCMRIVMHDGAITILESIACQGDKLQLMSK